MIQHVWERTSQARRVARVMIATDDERIARAATGFGAEARMTRADHRCGTDRVAEVASQVSADVYVNVQGDEPLIEPAAIDAATDALVEDDSLQVATIAAPISEPAEIMDPNVVKIVLDFDGNALYFSRAPVPWVRDSGARVHARHLKHSGLYVFRRQALLEFPTLPQGQLERLEQLEQLRWLENGWRIRVAEVPYDSVTVDVPEDISRVEALLRRK
jgi:3-deoxy-manno-octulosonate cytidylyltransferase (CMP-KDO synthetase)